MDVPGGEHRTLVVDDHVVSSRYAVAILRQCGSEVKCARTARQSLEIALNWYPDLICVDIHLPDSSGMDLIGLIRDAWPGDRPQPRIIVLTGDDSELERTDLQGLGISRLMIKPVSAAELRAAIDPGFNNRIGETGAGGHSPELQALFRRELGRLLPELDRCVVTLDHQRATGILHRLIASSAICDARKVEACLRALDACHRRDDPGAGLAPAYFAVLESVHQFLFETNRSAD